jgi:hypothetical protein
MALQRLATFAPNDVTVVITQQSTGIAHIVSGYSEDSIVNIERNAETFTMYTGADNTSTRIYNANKSAVITLSLQQTSASNDILSQLYRNDADSRDSSGLFSLSIVDASGRSKYFSDDAYIGVVPNSAFANSMQTRDWVLHAHNLDTFIGGNAVLTPEDQATLVTLGYQPDARWVIGA